MLTLENIQLIDTENMYDEIKNFHLQIDKSIEIIKEFNYELKNKVNKIIICGMGGSAIGGDFLSSILKNEINIPININRAYELPNWVDDSTLIVICSYSGNTEETISCYKEAVKNNFIPIIISSGGFLLKEAHQNNFPFIKLIPGIQPRAAFGYSSSLLFLLLIKLNLLDDIYLEYLQSSSLSLKLLSNELVQLNKNNKALELANKLYKKMPIIYGTSITDVVSLRFRGQLAENAKILSINHILPEQNHNEIEGFKNNLNNSMIIWITDPNDNERVSKRANLTSKILNDSISSIFCNQEGRFLLERMYKQIHFFDWVSFYLSIIYKQDPTPVNKIMELKKLM